ncbi:MAG TPA: alpha-N-arabinofuranosidase [Nocardioidaceae bacterium]
METATATTEPALRVGPVEQRLFGSFVEHMGRCVYTGIFEPGHPRADADGFRRDVLDLVRELGPTVVRYPGGNFVSSYRWEDGIGPPQQRPRRLDLAWRTIESNAFGVDEFMAWCAAVGTEPMMALNLGTRGVESAVDLVEYCNVPRGTMWSDLRRSHGRAEPYAVKLWCLGNELDGDWQVGHKTAHEYGRLAAETARAMRMVDPSVELVACGSSYAEMPTFGSWEETVLGECYDLVDSVSLHAYYEPEGDDLDSFLASSVHLERAIDAVVTVADRVRAEVGSPKRLRLSVDEWNVWYRQNFPSGGLDWAESRSLIEDSYDMVDAVVVGSLLIALLRHVDRVGIACQAQLVNVIAPILTEAGGSAWRQTTFHPFAQVTRYASGDVLRVQTRCPVQETSKHGEVPLLDAVATYDGEPGGPGGLVVFAVNRSRSEPIKLDLDLRAFDGLDRVEATTLTHDDPHARNVAADPDRVIPRPLADVRLDSDHLDAVLPTLSWNVLRLTG